MTRVLVSGDRKWKDRALVFEALDTWHATVGISVLIEGCAEGADRFAEEWCRSRLGKEPEHYPAPWDRLGKRAGVIRNSHMLIEGGPDTVIAFHDRLGSSVTTGDIVKKAQKAGVTVIHVQHPQPSELLEPEALAPSSPTLGF